MSRNDALTSRSMCFRLRVTSERESESSCIFFLYNLTNLSNSFFNFDSNVFYVYINIILKLSFYTCMRFCQNLITNF